MCTSLSDMDICPEELASNQTVLSFQDNGELCLQSAQCKSRCCHKNSLLGLARCMDKAAENQECSRKVDGISYHFLMTCLVAVLLAIIFIVSPYCGFDSYPGNCLSRKKNPPKGTLGRNSMIRLHLYGVYYRCPCEGGLTCDASWTVGGIITNTDYGICRDPAERKAHKEKN
ncbi:hypothetical protein JRQ81_015098 [Phrynocephalus forsythii]|uniref:Colipase n=1 Tax=Phrynocephalus forsythii TaxID=171643 RepID=A0A9Q0Y0J7_9SAUR|nr:hypothetical protein JRQ81_015098 [Phrynocephalus forsythii]